MKESNNDRIIDLFLLFVFSDVVSGLLLFTTGDKIEMCMLITIKMIATALKVIFTFVAINIVQMNTTNMPMLHFKYVSA